MFLENHCFLLGSVGSRLEVDAGHCVLGRGAQSCLPIFYLAVALSLSTAVRSVDLLTLLNGPLQLVPGSGRSLENPGISCGY